MMRVYEFFLLALYAATTIIATTPAYLWRGSFEVRLVTADPNMEDVLWRLCVKTYQSSPLDDGDCHVFGGEKKVDSSTLKQGVRFPFSFVWPRSFTLFVGSYKEKLPFAAKNWVFYQSYSEYDVAPSDHWTSVTLAYNNASVTIEYRVVCSSNRYGPDCSRYCAVIGRNENCTADGIKECAPGWSGPLCDLAVCEGCNATTGSCISPGNCRCDLGWTGPTCGQCVPRKGCLHGTCDRPNDCICEKGWGGNLCNKDLEYCTRRSPCKGSATCLNTGPGNYSCICPPGYAGINCEFDLRSYTPLLGTKNGCSNNPCLNGGKCALSGGTANYTCQCLYGYAGKHCEILPDICKASPRLCSNGGICESDGEKFVCKCRDGFSGTTCEEVDHPCLARPCDNNGQCLPKSAGTYECMCAPGFRGTNCDIKNITCELQPCRNGGTCEPLFFGHRCHCAQGFGGPDCNDVDEKYLFQMAHQWNSLSESFLIIIAVLIFLILLLLIVFVCWKCLRRQPADLDPVAQNMINAQKHRVYQLPSATSNMNRSECETPIYKCRPVEISKWKAISKCNEYGVHPQKLQAASATLNPPVSASLSDTREVDSLYEEIDGDESSLKLAAKNDGCALPAASELKELQYVDYPRRIRESSRADLHTNV